MNKPVAVKELASQFAVDKALDDWFREVSLMAILQHDNILSCWGTLALS